MGPWRHPPLSGPNSGYVPVIDTPQDIASINNHQDQDQDTPQGVCKFPRKYSYSLTGQGLCKLPGEYAYSLIFQTPCNINTALAKMDNCLCMFWEIFGGSLVVQDRRGFKTRGIASPPILADEGGFNSFSAALIPSARPAGILRPLSGVFVRPWERVEWVLTNRLPPPVTG